MAEAATISSPPKPNPLVLRVQVSCGDCMFFSNARLPNAASPCAQMGCPANRVPCIKYTSNVFSDAVAEAMESKDLRKMLNSIPDAALGALALALPEIRRLRAVGLRVGQLVYFNAVGPSKSRDYLANYYRARVLSLDRNGNVLLGCKGVTASINTQYVLTEEAWKNKRQKLIDKRHIFDPKSPFTWERKDEKILTKPKYRPKWLDKEVARYRATYFEAKATRQTHDYDAAPVKRGRGRPRKDGQPNKSAQKVRTHDISASA